MSQTSLKPKKKVSELKSLESCQRKSENFPHMWEL